MMSKLVNWYADIRLQLPLPVAAHLV